MKKQLNKAEETATKQENELEQKNPIQHYTPIYESVYLNNDFNVDEIALLFRLLTASPNFKPTLEKLIEILKISKRRVLKAISKLKKKGYLKIENHTFKGSKWIVSQEPTLNLEEVNEEELIYKLANWYIEERYIWQLFKIKKINYQQLERIITTATNERLRIGKIKWIKKPNE